jgi:long-subunit acyl-CoA synthetase (AMP-forming)
VDDVVVLALGEKVVPKPIENALMSSALISNAIVFGRERHHAGVLVEPYHGVVVENDEQRDSFVSEIWYAVSSGHYRAQS